MKLPFKRIICIDLVDLQENKSIKIYIIYNITIILNKKYFNIVLRHNIPFKIIFFIIYIQYPEIIAK